MDGERVPSTAAPEAPSARARSGACPSAAATPLPRSRPSSTRIRLPCGRGGRDRTRSHPHRLRPDRRPPLPPRSAGQRNPQARLAGRAGVRHGDPGGRARPRPFGLPPLDQLPVGGDLRDRGRGDRRRGEARRAGRGGRAHRARPGRGRPAARPRPTGPPGWSGFAPRGVGQGPTGGPKDDPEDLDLPIWAGQVPLRTTATPPVADESNPHGMAVPGYLTDYARPGRTSRPADIAPAKQPAVPRLSP